MNCLSVGSCLSNMTAIQLAQEYDFQRIGNVAHNRSDAFVNNFITKELPQHTLKFLFETIRFLPEKIMLENKF